jgi:hypothetical protein
MIAIIYVFKEAVTVLVIIQIKYRYKRPNSHLSFFYIESKVSSIDAIFQHVLSFDIYQLTLGHDKQ